MSCNEALRLQAYFDGELDAGAVWRSSGIWKAAPDCAALLADLEATRKLLRQDAPYHRADDGFARNASPASLDREEGVKPASGYCIAPRFLSGAASGAGGMALAALLVFFCVCAARRSAGGRFDERASAFADVGSSDRCGVQRPAHRQALVRGPHRCFAARRRFRARKVTGWWAAGPIMSMATARPWWSIGMALHVINVFAWAAATAEIAG